MLITPITEVDHDNLEEFQPPGWNDVPGTIMGYVSKTNYDPVKGEMNGEMVATGTIIFHEDTAWLAMIIVHPGHRNKGYGKMITRVLLDRINQARFRTIYLDATDMGFPVYKAIGFTEEVEYVHFLHSKTVGGSDPSEPFRPYVTTDRSSLLSLDEHVSGEVRGTVLEEHLQNALVIEQDRNVVAAFFPTLLDGPIIALNEEAAIPLMQERLRTFEKAQLPATNQRGIEQLLRLGCEEVRRSRRMFYGERRTWRPEMMWNRMSGELG